MKDADISTQIAEVARNYDYQKAPEALIYLQNLVAEALRWILDFWQSLHLNIPGMSDTRMVGDFIKLLLYVAGSLGALVVIFVVAKRIARLKGQSNKVKAVTANQETTLDAFGWRQEAERLFGRGEWRWACRALYLSLIRRLDENGIAAFAPTKTNFEYLYALSAAPELKPSFLRLVQRIEDIWFGERLASQDDFRFCLNELEEAEAEIEKASAGRGLRT